MLYDKQLREELWHIIKNSLMKLQKEKLRIFFYNMIERCWCQIREDASLKNLEDVVPDAKGKKVTDEHN